jgi:hypothetical protein
MHGFIWNYKRQPDRNRFDCGVSPSLVNELIEAKNESELNRVTNRWTRYDLIVLALLYGHADGQFYLREIARRAGNDKDFSC